MNQYWSTKRAVLVHITYRQSNPCNPYIRSLLRIWIKVVDEWQISLGYVRGSNIYVRGYLGLHTWSLRLRTQIGKFHYVKALFSPQEGHFSLRWIRGICAIRRRACLTSSERHIGELGRRCYSRINRGRARGNSLIYIQNITHATSPHHSSSCSTQRRYNGEHSLKRKSDL